MRKVTACGGGSAIPVKPRLMARIVRALVERTHEAAERTGATKIAVVGGVAANSELRSALPGARFAPLSLCTDNAAMIASAARFAPELRSPGYLALDAYASSSL